MNNIKIKGYKIISELGESPIANVYKAENLSKVAKNKIVAIKILKPKFAGDDEFVLRFHESNKRMITVPEHPSIVKVLKTVGNYMGAVLLEGLS